MSDSPAAQIVSQDVFLARLAALETWLWTEAAPALGMRVPPKINALAERVAALSDLYTTSRDSLNESANEVDHLAAKVYYFLASDAPKVFLVLRELQERYGAIRAKGKALRVIDAGAGVGATTAGFLLSLNAATVPRVDLHALDAEARSQRVWLAIARQCAIISGVRVETHFAVADLREPATVDVPADWDLFMAQAVLNELLFSAPGQFEENVRRRAEWVGHWAAKGLTVVIEPALKETTRPLQGVRDVLVVGGLPGAGAGDAKPQALAQAIQVLAPCPHQGACPMLPNPRDWCHEMRTLLPTPRVAQVQAITRRRDERTKFSFMALAPKNSGEPPASAPEPGTFSGRIVSDPLNSKGKLERWLCGSDGRLVQIRLLDKDRTEDNQLLATADRGTLVQISGGTGPPRLSRETVVKPQS